MRKNRLLSLLLMAAMLATTATFTACSGDKDGTSEKEPDKPDTGEGIKLGEPIGLVYTDFLTPNDVTHNADTTELRISKALADKKGITNFVNRPMGIWDQKEHRAYLRRATRLPAPRHGAAARGRPLRAEGGALVGGRGDPRPGDGAEHRHLLQPHAHGQPQRTDTGIGG